MNKKLVAVAVAGVLAAPLAAQAQTANVTLYGRLNLTMEAVKGDAVDPNLPATASAQNRTVYRVNSNSSRLGVRGSEALGGGLSAIFQIESVDQRGHRRRLCSARGNVRRPARRVGYVQDGLLPGPVRRHPPDLR